MNKKNKALSALTRTLTGALVGVVVLGACSPRVDNRGNQIHAEDVTAIEVGKTTRNEVLDTLGSPSSQGKFGTDVWYYVSERTETLAFFAPEVKERQVLAIEFDEAGVVSKVGSLDETQAEVVELAPGETPTAGNKLNFFQQMISNLGRFNKKKEN